MNLVSRRLLAITFALMAVFGAAGAPAFGAGATKMSPRAALLHASDLGVGWTRHESKVSLGVGCLRAVGVKSTQHGPSLAQVSFVDNANPPEITEVIGHFSTSTSASRVFARLSAALRACHQVRGYFSGHLLRGTVHALRVNAISSPEVARTATARVAGATVVEDLVVMRRAHVIVAISEGNVGAVDLSQFVGVAERALLRARPLAAQS